MKTSITFVALVASLLSFSTASVAKNVSVADWNEQIRTLIQEKTAYPTNAKRGGIEGQLKLRVKVSQRRVTGVELLETSGNDTLDNHAIGSVFRLQDLPTLPEGVESASFIIPVRYEIKDQ
jgi:TonB family protein